MTTPKPKPGTDVHLVLLEHTAYRHAKPTWTLDGTVIDTFWWERDPSVFCLLVPGDPVPTRSIRMDHVISINGELVRGWEATKKTKIREWTVIGSRGDRYVVRFDGNTWSCECRGFAFHRHCRHIDEISHTHDTLHTAS